MILALTEKRASHLLFFAFFVLHQLLLVCLLCFILMYYCFLVFCHIGESISLDLFYLLCSLAVPCLAGGSVIRDSFKCCCPFPQSNTKGGSSSLNEDTLGSQLKSGIAQYLALEISRGNGRDHRAITRYLPWLYHPPSAMQQG